MSSLKVFCRYCGERISFQASVCEHCQSPQNVAENERRAVPVQRANGRKNSDGVAAFIICLLFGMFGAHRFVYGRIGTGILMFITCGGFLIWWMVDLILIAIGTFKDGDGNRLSLLHNH